MARDSRERGRSMDGLMSRAYPQPAVVDARQVGRSVGHASETVSGLDEMGDHLLAFGVTTGHQEQFGRRPRPGQLPGRGRGTTEIQTAVNEHAGNAGETVGVSE